MHRTLFLTVLCAALAAPSLAALEQVGKAAAGEKPQVIVLGFDGVDEVLARQWMESGDLPNLKKLAERGSFRPLTTANPVQSPVSWGVMETASNPGKTNLGDFVRRTFSPSGKPVPALAGIKRMDDPVAAGDLAENVDLTRTERLLLPLGLARNRFLALALAGLLLFVLFALLFKFAFRFPRWAALPIGLFLGAGATLGLDISLLAGLPAKYELFRTEMRGERFWNALGDAGVRVTGLQVPLAFPARENPNARILGGLFVPDVAGGPGSWFIYTNDEWQMNEDGTNSGGVVYRLYEEKDGAMKASLRGPEDFVGKLGFKEEIDALEARLNEPGLTAEDRQEAEDALREAKALRDSWDKLERYSKVDLLIKPDYEKRQVEITVDGTAQVVKEGDFSDYYRMRFELGKPPDDLRAEKSRWDTVKQKGTSLARNPALDAIGRVYVEECYLDEDGSPRLRLFVPPLSISPENPPPWLPISSPRGYASELATAIGLFDTVGWACYTNALKDMETPIDAFMDGLEHVLGWRTRMLLYELDRNDFDVLFHVESVTDRAAHMLYAYVDPEHPLYGATEKDGSLTRDKEVRAYGRTFRVKDGIKETYREMDRVIGEVMQRIESRASGREVHLMVISDHGFQPFRYGVNLNVWLNRMGYLARTGEGEKVGAAGAAEEMDGSSSYLGFIDWSRTRAYSLGLGKIYINLKGREPLGIVPPEEFAPLKREIIAKLKEFVDPVEGHGKRQVVLNAYDAAEIYHGPYSEVAEDSEFMAGFGDIVLGFNQGYRVSWENSTGGYEKETYEDFGVGVNEEPWSGDHCGVELPLVNGIFFSSFRVPAGFVPDLINVAPTVLDICGVALPEDWDGTPIPRQ